MAVTNVVIDLGVNTDASGSVQVFSQNQPTISNKVIASVPVAATNFFVSGSSALIEFQGQGNDIAGRLESTWTTAAPGAATRKAALAAALQAALIGALNATDADPFNIAVAGNAKYTESGHLNYTSFGELALGAYAHYLFGHVDATAAISNDTTFVTNMNGTVEPAQANLGGKLANAIFALTNAQCATIAKQVVGQDAERAMGVDNDNTTPDGWQRLALKAGDKIYVSVTLQAPTVTVLNDNTAQQTEPGSALFDHNIKYMVEMVLN
jgi:hypothetical protein